MCLRTLPVSPAPKACAWTPPPPQSADSSHHKSLAERLGLDRAADRGLEPDGAEGVVRVADDLVLPHDQDPPPSAVSGPAPVARGWVGAGQEGGYILHPPLDEALRQAAAAWWIQSCSPRPGGGRPSGAYAKFCSSDYYLANPAPIHRLSIA